MAVKFKWKTLFQIRLEELEAAKKEVEKVTGEKPITQKMFKAI